MTNNATGSSARDHERNTTSNAGRFRNIDRSIQVSVWFVPVVLFIFSCLSTSLAAQETKKQDPLKAKKIKNIVETVSEIRDLNVKGRIQIKKMSRRELSKFIKKQLKEELPAGKAKKFERSLQAFGVFPKDKELLKTLRNVMVQSIAGFYNPETKDLYLIDYSSGDQEGGRLSPFRQIAERFGIEPLEVYASHEITHALQDQHFDLDLLPIRDRENDDRIMARKSLIEGEATYVMYQYLLKERDVSLKSIASRFDSLVKKSIFTASPDTREGNTPLYIRKSLIFPYMAGLRFVFNGLQGSDDVNWSKLNKAYRDVPVSTEQILHPEKYFQNRDRPEWPQLPEFPTLTERNRTFLQSNNFGEYGIHLVFLEHFPEKQEQIRSARTGWDGDMYRTYYNPSTDRSGYVWMTTWDSEKDANEFSKLYGNLLSGKYESAMKEQRSGRQVLLSENGRLSFIHRNGTDVLVGEGFSFKTAMPVIKRAWRETDWVTPESGSGGTRSEK